MIRVRYEFTAGIFLLCAMALFALSVWTLGRERQIFATQQPYSAVFKDVKGLAVGAPVRLGGINVGRVAEVDFAPSLQDSQVNLKLLINEKYVERIKTDSIVSIETQGLLGDRFVSINPGTEIKQLLPGQQLQVREADDIGELANKASQVVNNAVSISENLRSFSGELRADTVKSLSDASKNLAAILKEVEQGDGVMHRLVYSKQDGEAIVGSISGAAKDIKALTRRVRSGQGLLHALLFDPKGAELIGSLSDAAAKISSTSNQVGELAVQIKNGKGLANSLFYADAPEGLEQIITKLNQVASNLQRASEALSSGSGTLGALLVDPKLYDNLVEVTDDAKRSFLLREAIRASLGE